MTLLHSSRSTSPGSSTYSTGNRRAVSLNSAALQTTPPAYSEKGETISLRDHYRGHYSSNAVQLTDYPTVRVTSTGVKETSSFLPSSNDFNDRMISTFRSRSRSPGPRELPRVIHDEGELRPPTSDNPLSTSWWGEEKHAVRSWRDPMKKTEQTEALQSTRKKVAQALGSALETAADITHEALFIGVDLLGFAPIPGLQAVGHLLLNIWDASQLVDMNVLSCLRLTARCADILISVREEIFDAGDVVGQELAASIRKLEESFEGVHHFLIKLSNRPFLKRYLRRDEILRDISDCDSSLRDALGLFGISIQIRILKQVQEAEKHRQEETNALLEAIMTGRAPHPSPASDSDVTYEHMRMPQSINYQSETVAHFTTTENALGLFEGAPHLSLTPADDLPPSQIIPALTSLYSIQNSLDTAMDTANLREVMRAALQTSSDAEMIEVLEISLHEMPDAIKTLQRTLEQITERDDDAVEAPPGEVVVTKVVKVSEKEVKGHGRPLKRSRTMISIDNTNITSSGRSSERKDTLDREFIESGIDCLRRMSRGIETSVPSWTITKYEVDRDKKIGVGFFSDVYKGTWRGRTVAIKVLADTTPRNLFLREVGIWKTLRHPNVLRLYGASSASGDLPWFFVSSYMKNGSLVQYLKRVELEERPSNLAISMGYSQMLSPPIRNPPSNLGSGTFPAPWKAVRGISSTGSPSSPEDSAIHQEWDLFRFMHEIAQGMEYLHNEGVLHGDLKGANVLVDDEYRCVISDFGQSEMKSEVYRISGTLPPHGTFRWQSPELMAGQSQLTQATDVWAFSMCCVEILTMGRIPWSLHDDDSVRYFVLKCDSRPPLPNNSRFNTQGLQDILRTCWSTKPTQRPTFSKVVKDFKQLWKSSGQEIVDTPQIPVIDEESETPSPSPDMRPTSFIEHLQAADSDLLHDILPDIGNIFQNPQKNSDSSDHPHSEITVSTDDVKKSELVIYTPLYSSRSFSFNLPATSSSEEHPNPNVIDYDGNDSPPPVDERIADIWNERRYRLLLTHNYHPSLTLPLWDPSPVEVGAVGYLSKPQGRFVTLFNALTPGKAMHLGIQSLPSIHGYGPTQVETHRQDRRTVAQKSIDAFAGLLTFRTFSEKVSRRYSYPLKAGHKMAYLCTETTDYRYLEKLDAPKKWFQTNVDFIMQTYGSQHHLQKEDLFLVIGTLSAPNYALFVSHRHPEGHAHFSVYATSKTGKPWGAFTIDTEVPPELGPSYDEAGDTILIQDSKVSNHGGPWDSVLLARLRFKPDVLEPTSK